VAECGQSIGVTRCVPASDKPRWDEAHYVWVPVTAERTLVLRLVSKKGGQEDVVGYASLPIGSLGKGQALQQDVKLLGPQAGDGVLRVALQVVPLSAAGAAGAPALLPSVHGTA
jgi:Ca2+-dependent lipid-binding protein